VLSLVRSDGSGGSGSAHVAIVDAHALRALAHADPIVAPNARVKPAPVQCVCTFTSLRARRCMELT
jgi:hypothetical protein